MPIRQLSSSLLQIFGTPRRQIAAATPALAIVGFALMPPGRYSAGVFLAISALCVGMLASVLTGRWRDAAAIAAAVLIALALVESALVVSMPSVAPPATYSANFYRADPVLGYGALPSKIIHAVRLDGNRRTIFNVTYTIDERGVRRTVSNPHAPTVAFFFDSGTFGEGVDDNETLPQQFADLTVGKYHVVNLGFPGYGPQTMLRTLETGLRNNLLAPRPLLFVVETGLWHAEQAACRSDFAWSSPRYELVYGTPVYRGPCAGRVEHWALHRLGQSYLYSRLIHPRLVDDRADAELYLGMLNQAVAIARRDYDAPTIILYARWSGNRPASSGFTDGQIIEGLRAGGATVLDVNTIEAGETDLRIAGDGHPTAKANHLRAVMLRDLITQTESIDPIRH